MWTHCRSPSFQPGGLHRRVYHRRAVQHLHGRAERLEYCPGSRPTTTTRRQLVPRRSWGADTVAVPMAPAVEIRGGSPHLLQLLSRTQRSKGAHRRRGRTSLRSAKALALCCRPAFHRRAGLARPSDRSAPYSGGAARIDDPRMATVMRARAAASLSGPRSPIVPTSRLRRPYEWSAYRVVGSGREGPTISLSRRTAIIAAARTRRLATGALQRSAANLTATSLAAYTNLSESTMAPVRCGTSMRSCPCACARTIHPGAGRRRSKPRLSTAMRASTPHGGCDLPSITLLVARSAPGGVNPSRPALTSPEGPDLVVVADQSHPRQALVIARVCRCGQRFRDRRPRLGGVAVSEPLAPF